MVLEFHGELMLQDDEWRLIGKSPIQPLRLPRGILQFKLEKEGYETAYFSSSNPSLKLYNSPVESGWSLEPIKYSTTRLYSSWYDLYSGGQLYPCFDWRRR